MECIIGTALLAPMSRLIAHFVYCEKDAWNQFSPDAYPNLMCREKKNSTMGEKRQIIWAYWHQEVGNEDATNRRGDVKDTDLRPWVAGRGGGMGGRVTSPAPAGWERLCRRHHNNTGASPAAQNPSQPSTMLPSAFCKCILTASLQMIQKPDVTGFLITF